MARELVLCLHFVTKSLATGSKGCEIADSFKSVEINASRYASRLIPNSYYFALAAMMASDTLRGASV
jgi:hypothetical protein